MAHLRTKVTNLLESLHAEFEDLYQKNPAKQPYAGRHRYALECNGWNFEPASRRFESRRARHYMSFASSYDPWRSVQEERFALLSKVLLRPPGHQFQSPRTRMVAGTSRMRIIVASTKTATARPRPMVLVMMTLLKANAPVTTITMAAADVMMPAVDTSPFATLAVLESPFS